MGSHNGPITANIATNAGAASGAPCARRGPVAAARSPTRWAGCDAIAKREDGGQETKEQDANGFHLDAFSN
jgi:hypothetical protein